MQRRLVRRVQTGESIRITHQGKGEVVADLSTTQDSIPIAHCDLSLILTADLEVPELGCVPAGTMLLYLLTINDAAVFEARIPGVTTEDGMPSDFELPEGASLSAVTADYDAAIYRTVNGDYLDHSPETLGYDLEELTRPLA